MVKCLLDLCVLFEGHRSPVVGGFAPDLAYVSLSCRCNQLIVTDFGGDRLRGVDS